MNWQDTAKLWIESQIISIKWWTLTRINISQQDAQVMSIFLNLIIHISGVISFKDHSHLIMSIIDHNISHNMLMSPSINRMNLSTSRTTITHQTKLDKIVPTLNPGIFLIKGCQHLISPYKSQKWVTIKRPLQEMSTMGQGSHHINKKGISQEMGTNKVIINLILKVILSLDLLNNPWTINIKSKWLTLGMSLRIHGSPKKQQNILSNLMRMSIRVMRRSQIIQKSISKRLMWTWYRYQISWICCCIHVINVTPGLDLTICCTSICWVVRRSNFLR